MSISRTPFAHGQLVTGGAWIVTDENLLAETIARVALGQSRHVQKILAGINLSAPPSTANTVAGAIKLLTVTGTDPWHRDGWMFQVMSWIAANIDTPNGIIRSPHMIRAHKGFDGIQLQLDVAGEVGAVVIFEDKATGDPRRIINTEVWKDFREFEQGHEEHVLTAEVSSLLQTCAGIDVDKAIEKVIWNKTRRYRVCITVGDTHATPAGRLRLFADYDTVTPGALEKRRGETFHIASLRNWMDALAIKAIAFAKTTDKSNV